MTTSKQLTEKEIIQELTIYNLKAHGAVVHLCEPEALMHIDWHSSLPTVSYSEIRDLIQSTDSVIDQALTSLIRKSFLYLCEGKFALADDGIKYAQTLYLEENFLSKTQE